MTEYSYTFNEGGTGKYTGVAGVSASFTWTLEDSTLKMVASGASLDLEIFNKSYTVSVDGDKLTLTDSDSSSVTLTKVNS